ncbi:MAG TPA: hypothetical protein VEL07_19275 [Planctomycetota bacterium]|nr:hypothetical protein [Planctomycetota bacterium]
MAVVNYTVQALAPGASNRDCVLVSWALANGDSGTPFDGAAYADRSVQVRGTFGAGGNARIEGSLLPSAAPADADYATLTDPQGNALDITAEKIEAVSELTRLIRPRITAGDGTTALVVYLIARRK